jgi:hypothetical protein
MEKREVWRTRVQEWQASGRTLADFCRGKGFTPSGLRYWVKRLGASAETPPEAPAAPSKPVRIARVVRARPTGLPASITVTAASAVSADHFVIEACAMRVLVPVGLEPARLEAVLVAIGRASMGGAP